MQVRHAQRQLLSRCTLRSYSVGAAAAARKTVDSVATSDTPVSRLKRPLASTFGGIDIQNVAVPTQKPRGGTSRFPRSGGSDDKSPDTRMRRKSQTDRFRGQGKTGWDDGLVSLSFSNRLRHHQNKDRTARGTTDLPSEAQPRRQQSKQFEPTQRPQMMHGNRREQKERRDASPNAPRRSPRGAKTNSDAAKHEYQRSAKSEASSMTRHSASSFDLHARSRSTTTTTSPTKTPKAKASLSKASKTKPPSTSTTTSTQSTKTTAAPSTADRSARLAALSNTNLNALFRTRDAPTSSGAGTSLPLPSASPASMTTRVRGVLERSAGDYSRFLPRRVGVRKNASRLPALRTARHALAVQRDVSLEQRRVALHIIGGLAQADRPQVRA